MKLNTTLKAAMIASAVATVVAGTAVTAPAQAQEVKLKAASFLPTRIVFAKYFVDWTKSVNEQCKGMVSISVVGPAAIKSLEQWNAVKNGVVDMHYGPATYYKGTAPEAGITDLATKSPAEQRANGAHAMLDDLHVKKMNSRYMTQILDGVPFFVYTSKPAENGGFKDFRLRSVPIYDAFFKHLGANPVRMGAPAVYTALERKVVDGMGWPLWGVTGFGWDKYIKFRHGPGFYTAGVNIIMNNDKWKGLSAKARDCLTERSVWMEKVWPEWREAQNKKEIEAQDKAGIKYVDMGKAFRDKAHELYWEDMMKINAEFTKKMRPLLTDG